MLEREMMDESERESWAMLFPSGTRVKDVQDTLFFALTCFDPEHPNYTPRFQKSAIDSIRQVLGVKDYRY